jgi:hypothetical protein
MVYCVDESETEERRIVSPHKLVDFFLKVPVVLWIFMITALAGWASVSLRRARWRFRSQQAESWPVVEGTVQNTDVLPLSNQSQLSLGCEANLVYSYSLLSGSETEYYSGKYHRLFSDEGLAWDWLRTLQDKRIPVHYNPRRPQVSAIRDEELERIFPLPPEFVESAAHSSPDSSLPDAGMRGMVDLGAWIAAVVFLVAFTNHIEFLVTGHELVSNLNVALWVLLFGAGVPFSFWYRSRTGVTLWGKPKNWSHVPQWIRAFVLLLNVYIPLHWFAGPIADAFHSVALHHRLDPFANGAFLAVLWGDSAAILYSYAAHFENPYRIGVSIEPE